MKLFGREPTLWLSVIYAIVTVAGTFGLLHFSGNQAALTNAALAALFGAINAWAVRPISPVAFTYAIGALVALAASYGLNVPDTTLAAINGIVVPLLALLSRGQVSPEETAVSNA